MMFLTKTDGYQKIVWHKQKCDSNEHDCKGGSFYIKYVV
jgi:hypothetical protein